MRDKWKNEVLEPEPGQILWCSWELPEIRGTLFWGPYDKDPIICCII